MKKKQYHRIGIILALLTTYCISLLLIRIEITNTFYYRFLVWNLFLAYIPFVIGKIMISKKLTKPIIIIGLLVWLVFLPNAPYIVTDIFHLKQRAAIPIWFDLLLLLSFALNGMLVFFLSVYDCYKLIGKHFSKIQSYLVITSIFFLTGFGVYLGRFLRFNSWDVLSDPSLLVVNIFDRIVNPMLHLRTWGFTLGFGTLFLLLFLMMETLIPKEQ